jgi:hypothetical protein
LHPEEQAGFGERVEGRGQGCLGRLRAAGAILEAGLEFKRSSSLMTLLAQHYLEEHSWHWAGPIALSLLLRPPPGWECPFPCVLVTILHVYILTVGFSEVMRWTIELEDVKRAHIMWV